MSTDKNPFERLGSMFADEPDYLDEIQSRFDQEDEAERPSPSVHDCKILNGLLCTPDQADELARYVSPVPHEDNELFGRLVDAVQIDYETAEEDPVEHLQMLVDLWKATPRTDAEAHQKIQRRMMLATNGMECHPEWFNHSCMCEECRSC